MTDRNNGCVRTERVTASGLDGKSFRPTKVLRGVDFAVAPGEICALLGDNGRT